MIKHAEKIFTMTKKRITETEVNQLYARCKTPPHVIAHCKAVADTAVTIGAALNQKGYQFDLSLLRSAGLAHDIARIQEDHGAVAADILQEEPMPVILDDTFAFYDEKRLKSALKWLRGQKRQVIILSCNKREEEILKQF